MKEYDERMARVPDPFPEERLEHDKARIAKLVRQLECEREWFLNLMAAAGNCSKCRFFAVCGPQYDCRKTLKRKLAGYVKRVLA